MSKHHRLVGVYVIPIIIIGIFYGIVEFLIALNTETPEAFWPLMAKIFAITIPLGLSIGAFEIGLKTHFNQRPFLYLVLVKTLAYTLILSFWLSIINGFWQVIAEDRTFWEGIIHYLNDPMYFINLSTIFLVVLIYSSLLQINSLHRKGELINFIAGRYHQPREIERIFAFIDLKGSTTIAESLGHKQFGMFLKDYYSDITEPVKNSKAEIYQYVGDEVILSWKPSTGLKDNNAVLCITDLQQVIKDRSSYYENQYGYIPQFRVGMHLGKVLVTWVGELKKEILYIGDVMNTTARIQEECKRLQQDFLISEEIAGDTKDINGIKVDFEEQTVPRGKEKPVRLYSVNSYNNNDSA
jgi:adenylate cyclase